MICEEGLRSFISSVRSFIWHRSIKFNYKLKRIGWRLRYGEAAPSITDLIYVDPTDIKRMATGHRPFSTNSTTIIGGEWDRRKFNERFNSERQLRAKVNGPRVARLKQYSFFKSVKDHFENNIPWEETEFYQYKLQSDEKGHYATEDKLKERVAEIDKLYQTMHEIGYKSQRELQKENLEEIPFEQSGRSPPEIDEVAVAISRDGEFLHVDGRHRLAVAKAVGVDEIPVRVVARHTKWQKLRSKVGSSTDSVSIDSNTNLSSNHPDLIYLIK